MESIALGRNCNARLIVTKLSCQLNLNLRQLTSLEYIAINHRVSYFNFISEKLSWISSNWFDIKDINNEEGW